MTGNETGLSSRSPFFLMKQFLIWTKRGIHYIAVLTHELILYNIHHLTLCLFSLLTARTHILPPISLNTADLFLNPLYHKSSPFNSHNSCKPPKHKLCTYSKIVNCTYHCTEDRSTECEVNHSWQYDLTQVL